MARKILLADDSVTAQNMGRKILADAGYEVITVNNGSAALKRIGEQRPDLIVLDVYMPGYSGLEVCQRLKDSGDTSRIPIVLTVGKLEPFKPEEAKRVRADGFIVKPFEASELLSTLSKLEDKIVPDAEASKTGRFARSTPRGESPYDKTMAADDDSGWKRRIIFPKKKETDEEPAAEQPAASASAGAVAEAKPAQEPQQAEKVEESRVDLGALAPQGLPSDVTPEEIAALAAAAARVRGAVAEDQVAEPVAEQAAPVQEIEEKAAPVAEMPAAPEVVAPAAASASVNEAETIEMPAVRTLEPAGAEVSGNGSGPQKSSEPFSEEPVTMAAAAAAAGLGVSRWTAVSVAVAPEEASASLEEEMRQAYATFAAADNSISAVVARSEAAAAKAASASASADDTLTSMIPVPRVVAPEVAQTLNAIASAASGSLSAPVAELDPGATTFIDPRTVSRFSPPEAALPETQRVVVPQADPEPATPAAPVAEASGETKMAEVAASLAAVEDHPSSKPEQAAVAAEPSVAATVEETAPVKAEEPSTQAPEQAPPTAEPSAMAVAVGAENTPEEASASQESDPAIASIVDSVLADLRPKIVEEISRKFGKKK